MENFSDRLEEIKTLLSSNTDSHKSFAYLTLLGLQEQASSGADSSPIQSLADSSRCLLSWILRDIFSEDEEIAAQALKCLGFTIYHPTLVAANSRDDANLIINSLSKIIVSTRMKSICNLGVWCISIQQLDAMHLDANFHSLLRAIVHALENPMGSLSTTFEAVQAVMKLANQLHEKMRDTSSIWAPSIYRRLISTDKRLRDMCERCLLKISSVLCPPPLALSKVLVTDIRTRLIPGMKGLLINGLKIQTIQAWGWFIRLLGPYAVKNRHLVNEMLKVPEQTFSDGDPQLQIASLASWEGLIDALIQPPIRAPETNSVDQPHIQQAKTYERNNNQTEDGISKGVRLIMMPLIGILSSKCDVSVQSSCLNIWCYLLHKLDISINCPSILKTVWEPILDTVFKVGPDSKSILLWNVCLDLLDDFILTKHKDMDLDLDNQGSCQSSPKIPATADPVSGKWKHYAIKWLPWDLNHLDFCMKMIRIVLSHEVNSSACDAALRIFKSVLKGIRNVLRNSSINYDKVMLCLNEVLRFVKGIFEGINSENCEIDDNHCATSLRFAVAVIEGLEPSILGSPLYKVELDLKYIDHLKSVDKNKHAELLRVQLTAYKDMVLPIVYLIILHFCGVFKSTSNGPGSEYILQETSRYFKFVLLSFEPSAILHPIIGLFYKHVGYEYLKIWAAVADSLTDYIDKVKDISCLKLETDIPCCLAVCQLFFYPFAVCSFPQRVMMMQSSAVQESSNFSLHSQTKLELEHAFEAWKSLYACVYHASSFDSSTSNSFVDDMLLKLNGYLFENTRELESWVSTKPSNSTWDHDFHFLFGNVVICVLEHITTSRISSGGSKDRDNNHHKRPGNMNNSLEIAARFMTLSRMMAETNPNPPTGLAIISRVFSTLVQLLGCLHLKEDILSFIQITSCPLLQWLSSAKLPCEDTTHQLQQLWSETLYSLQRSHPPIEYNSSFLKLQAPLLEKTLDHPNPSISEPTIIFWNSTYAEEIKLDYPQNLLPILDKLSRNQRLTLSKRSHPSSAPHRYRVMATQNRSSKRVEFVEDKAKLSPCMKRRRQELTEHQKEVRRAQQGRERDCNGHGPGIRTYTTVDFSQGNEESQDSQEIRDAEAILEMLKRSG